MKPIRVEMRLKNNILLSLRENTGLSPRALAEKISISYTGYLDIESLRISPLCTSGEWTRRARKIAAYWKMLPEDLFPKAVLRVRKTSGSFAMDERQIDRLLAVPRESLPELPEEIPDRAVLTGEVRIQVEKLFEKYRASRAGYSVKPATIERNITMWKMRHGWDGGVEQTEIALAEMFGLSRDRVNQIMTRFERYFEKGLQQFADHS
jgi:transcriptional regulator with XRE-family HTH domain